MNILSKLLKSKKCFVSPNPFINKLEVYKEPCNSIIFVDCLYDVSFFSPSLFELFQIFLSNQIKGSVAKRQAEFLAGRIAAKLAVTTLTELGNIEIKVGNNREPIWPEGIIGSISHTNSRAICVVGKSDNIEGLGIDIEYILNKSSISDIQQFIHNQEELNLITEQGLSESLGTTIIFSAKESFFKGVFPQVGEIFGFECARVMKVDLSENKLILRISDTLVKKNNLKNKYIVWFEYDFTSVTTLLIVNN